MQSVNLLFVPTYFCRKLHLFLGKSTKTAATKASLFYSNIHQIVCLLGLSPKPYWGSLQRSPDPFLYLGGLLLKRGKVDKMERKDRLEGVCHLPQEKIVGAYDTIYSCYSLNYCVTMYDGSGV